MNGWPDKSMDYPEWMTEANTFHTARARLAWSVGNLCKAIGDSIRGRRLGRIRVACWHKGGAIHDFWRHDPWLRVR
jgi:hypothetical protein